MRTIRLKVGTKTRMRYPRTGNLKRTGWRPPSRPPELKRWLTMPLHVAAGRFRRLRRERFTKPVRVQYQLTRRAENDKALAKELGIAES